jgi:hypothetical protein
MKKIKINQTNENKSDKSRKIEKMKINQVNQEKSKKSK